MLLRLEYFLSLRAFARRGWIKLSELQESIRALVLTPLMVTLVLDLSRVGGVEEGTVASVGYTEAEVSGWPPAELDLQSVASFDTSYRWHP